MKAGIVKKNLEKLREMPEAKKKMAPDMDALMIEEEPEGEMAEALGGKETMAEEAKELGMMSDEELLAELQKRGLSSGKAGAKAPMMEEEDEEELTL